jgi:hypothetical protein
LRRLAARNQVAIDQIGQTLGGLVATEKKSRKIPDQYFADAVDREEGRRQQEKLL